MADHPKLRESDLEFQSRMLQQVSQTYAMTIPMLPSALQDVVTNGYLLCRIADSIEDDPDMSASEKEKFLEQFASVVSGELAVEPFASNLTDAFGQTTSESVRSLVKNSDRVIRTTLNFETRQRTALNRCIRIMSTGMIEFLPYRGTDGLDDVSHLERYCYFVAGVVGQMLAELFCAYSPEIDRRSAELMTQSVSCGKGVQMTNIIKDIWDDREDGMCWLPKGLFLQSGCNLNDLAVGQPNPGFSDGLGKLIAIAKNHLLDGLEFALTIPSAEFRIRRHIVSSLGLSALMLRSVYTSDSFDQGHEIKLSKPTVRMTMVLLNFIVRFDFLLRTIFCFLARTLPKTV